MTPSDFKTSTAGDKPPADLTPPLEALWWAAKGDWDKAHKIVMDEETRGRRLGARLSASRRGRSAECALLVRAGEARHRERDA